MPPQVNIILVVILGYIIGSIPTAYWFGKAYKKVDIRDYGSGNVGATNAFRVLGKWPGIAVLILDIIKGIIPTTIIASQLGGGSILLRVLAGVMAIIGHNWTVFLSFKGGKGIATSLGVLTGLTIAIAGIRPVLAITVLVWGITFLVTGYVSLSSIIAATVLPFLMIISSQPFELIALGITICIFVVLRHRANIKRLMAQEEPRVNLFRKK